MIHNIIHISDIHIRSGDSKKSRYDEYISVFNNLAESVSQQPSILNKSAVIVITGDIFHDKNRIGPSGLEAATYLLQKLSPLATVIIIRGNHDYRQDHPLEHDMISALVSYNIPNVIYFDKTDVHKFQNIYFGLTAIQETLLYGSTSGIANNLPPFPAITSDVLENTYKVALFHGTINGCTLQNGSKTTRDGYPIDWFQGYDTILLGDIHLQQVNRASIIDNTPCTLPHTSICQTYSYENQIPWGYAGSLVQQDFGETIKGHGYVLWNLREKLINIYHVKNNYGMIKIHFNGNIDELDVEHKQYIKPITRLAALHKIINTKWFPDMLHVRVFSSIGADITAEDLRLIAHKIESYGKTVLSITKKTLNTTNANVDKPTDIVDSSEILNINSTESLVEYIQNKINSDNKTLSTDKWKQWILHPETLIIPLEYIPHKIYAKIQSKGFAIDRDAREYIQEFERVQSHNVNAGVLELYKLEWSWVLNYKSGNVFDFRQNTKSIVVLNAKNGSGKSNFLEIICIALFGEGFPSRHNTNYSSTIICDKKPGGVVASTRITFSLNDEVYMIERTMRNNINKRSINFEDVTLYRFGSGGDEGNDRGEKEIVHQKNVAVSAWIDLNIGKCSTYLMSTMLTQNADSDFFSLDHKTQKDLLDRILSLDHINSLKKLLKNTHLYYKYSADLIETYYDGVTMNQVVPNQEVIDEIARCKPELERLRRESDELINKWNMCSERDLITVGDYKTLEGRVSQLRNLNTLPCSLADAQRAITDVNRVIRETSDELARFHSFSDLSEGSECPRDTDGCAAEISRLLLLLQQHPFYKKSSEYDIYDSITTIRERIRLEDKNDIASSELVKLIYEFETWDKLQTEMFGRVAVEDQVQVLHDTIESLNSEISDFPDRILAARKTLDASKKAGNKRSKEKEAIMDRRPNKPVKEKEWLDGVALHITEYGGLDEHLDVMNSLIGAIRIIPAACHNILNAQAKITEHMLYIQECSEYAYNDLCWACKQQPWRTKYEAAASELPGLKKRVMELEEELAALAYEGIEMELDVSNYKVYMVELDAVREIYAGHIADIKLYRTEIKAWEEWTAWSAAAGEAKLRCAEADTATAGYEREVLDLEKAATGCRVKMAAAVARLDSIESRRREYDAYLAERGGRSAAAAAAERRLVFNWYTTLLDYRLRISSYLKWGERKMKEMRGELEALLLLLQAAEEREAMSKELEGLLRIYEAYPSWVEWKRVNEEKEALALKVAEMEVVTRGMGGIGIGIGVGIGDSEREAAQCLQLLADIKSDNLDIAYIADAFTGYREWLYTHNIGPIIQRRVNGILDMMCEDGRLLFLECEWLEKIDTLSWFMRDGESRVIIQKASGFQRFIIGVAMRVAFNQMGFSRIRFSELFIDEGFTACDTDNLERIPEFLRGLLGFYNTIYLATHLEDLKGCADKQILIKRGVDGLSQIQYGDLETILAATATATATTGIDEVKGKRRAKKGAVVVIKA